MPGGAGGARDGVGWGGAGHGTAVHGRAGLGRIGFIFSEGV